MVFFAANFYAWPISQAMRERSAVSLATAKYLPSLVIGNLEETPNSIWTVMSSRKQFTSACCWYSRLAKHSSLMRLHKRRWRMESTLRKCHARPQAKVWLFAQSVCTTCFPARTRLLLCLQAYAAITKVNPEVKLLVMKFFLIIAYKLLRYIINNGEDRDCFLYEKYLP